MICDFWSGDKELERFTKYMVAAFLVAAGQIVVLGGFRRGILFRFNLWPFFWSKKIG